MMNIFNPLWIVQNVLTLNWVGAAISIGGSLLGGALGDDAADDAAGSQIDAAQMGIDEIKKIGSRTREDTAPYRALGSGSANQLAYLLGISSSPNGQSGPVGAGDLINTDDGAWKPNEYLYDNSPEYRRAWDKYIDYHFGTFDEAPNSARGTLENAAINRLKKYGFDIDQFNAEQAQKAEAAKSDPLYGSLTKSFTQDDLDNDLVYQNGLQFGLDEGNKAIENRARALGGYDSGSVLKALTRYGNDYATTKTEGAYNRFTQDKNQKYNFLTGGTSIGQNAVNTDANTGSQLAQALAGQYNAQGNARSAGQIGGANAWGKAIGGVADAIGGLF